MRTRHLRCGRPFIVVTALTALMIATSANSTTVHVPADHPTIQQAILAVTDGDEIVVAPGTYFENIDLLGKSVTLRSSGGPDVTIIDGQDRAPAIVCHSGETPETVIQGFTIRNEGDQLGGTWWSVSNIDSSPTIVDCRLTDLALGIYNEGGSPTITGSTFEDIGGYFCDGCGAVRNVNATVQIADSTFTRVESDGLASAVFSIDSDVTITNSTFHDNAGHTGAGAIRQAGGNLTVSNSTFTENDGGQGDAGAIGPAPGGTTDTAITISESVFESNWGGFGSAAVRGAHTIIGSTFSGNFSEDGGAVRIGDGLIEDCTFVDNSANFFGAAITTTGSPTILNCTFINNTGPTDPFDPDGAGAIFVIGDELPAVGGSTFCGNAPDHIHGSWSNLGGNSFNTTCPTGDLNSDGVVDIFDLLILLDNWGECADPDACPADLDGDTVVDVFDLLILLDNWG